MRRRTARTHVGAARSGGGASRAADQPRAPRLPRATRSTRPRRPATRPTGSARTAVGVLWTYADRNADGTYRRVGGGDVRRRDEHLRPGRVQRRRHLPRRRRLPAPLAADRRGAEPRARLRAAARPDLPADRPGPNAGNVVLWMQPDGTLQPERRPARAARPVRQRRVVLAGPHASGRSARATPRSGATTRRSRASCATGSTWRSARSTARSSTRYGSTQVVDGRACPPG